MKQFMTVVMQYEEGAELPKRITDAFAKDRMFEGVEITAVSHEDEILRVEKLEASQNSPEAD